MKLKSIEIKGFKSFYHRTKIEFPDGIVSIVGPNGSGKSNILDAFRWVLGEQSAKNLRGDKMEDVIFSGTKRHNQSNSCEVEVIFDNEDGALDIEFTEISIKRKAYRTGESNYFINGKTTRLKEIKELLLDSGIGKEGYSVISQGKIDEIVHSTSSQRRKLLEEASGIARFRFKKEESEKKIDNAKVNLERLEDIYKEIERQIEPLYHQKEKALQYCKIRDELKETEICHMLKEYDEVFITNENDIKQHAKICDNVAEIERELEANKESILLLEENNRQFSELMQKLEQEKNRLHLEKIEAANEIQRIKDRNEIKRGQVDKLIVNQERMNAAIDSEEESQEYLLILESETKKEYNEKNHFLEKLDQQRDDLQNRLNELDGQIDFIYRENREIADKISKNEIKIQFISESIKREELKRDENTNNIHRTRDKLDGLQLQAQLFVEQIKDIEKTLGDFYNQKKSLKEWIYRLEVDMDSRKKQLDSKNQILRDSYLKYSMYSSMEKDMEGINKSVKAILNNKELQGIKDIVSNVIQTEQKYEKAVETALGSAMQQIITVDSNAAKLAIDYLKKTGSGRATFLPMDVVKPNLLNLNGEKLASDVVRCHPMYQGIVQHLLGRTLIIDTIDSAITRAKQYGHKYRIVTLEGELLNPGGSITGGHYYKSSSLLSRKRQIDEHKQKMDVLQKEIDTMSKELEEVKSQYQEQVKRSRDIEEKIAKQQMELQSKGLQSGDLKNRINYLNNTLDNMLDETKGSAAQETENYQIIQEIAEQLTNLEEELTENKYRMEDLQSDRKKFEFELSGKIKERENARDSQMQLHNKLEKITWDIQRSLEHIEQIRNQLSESNEELATIHQEISFSDNHIQEVMLKLQLCEVEYDETISEFEEAQARLQTESKKNESVSTLKNTLETKKMELLEERYRFEGKIDRVKFISNKITERLEDEYAMTIDEARALNIQVSSDKEKINRLKQSISDLGNINMDAIEDYNTLKERYDTYQVQIEDLTVSITELEKIIAKLEEDMANDFNENFRLINQTFGEVFSKIFGGGEGKLVISNQNDVLNSDIEIYAQPPGKKLKTISVMSGGEKALMGIALLFAIQMTKPAPFCILDEIDAALDDANISRFSVFLKQMSDMIQFITITHRRGTMESSDYIYGVTMQDKGVSKLVSLKFEDAKDYIEQ